jgi:hypothetical protein
MKIQKMIAGAALVLASVVSVAEASPGNPYPGPGREVYLGEANLSSREGDVDWVYVDDCRDGSWDRDMVAVQVENLDTPVELQSVVLRFGNGRTQMLPLREFFRPWTASRWIDLVGERRCIREIRVVGDAEGYNGRRARVRIYGWRVR